MDFGGPEKRHAAYGHVIRAQYAIGLPACESAEGPLGTVLLRAGDCPDHLDNCTRKSRGFEVSPTEVLLKPRAGDRELGRIFIRGGTEILVAPAAKAGDLFEPFILGSGLAAICFQKGLLPLHASAVSLGKEAIAFAGPSGAGKSTMAAAVAAHGHTHISDDLAVLRFPSGGRAQVYPGTQIMKLAGDSTAALGIEVRQAEQGPRPRGKLRFRNRSIRETAQPTDLTAIYLLELSDDPAVTIEPVVGIDAVTALVAQIYRRGWLRPMGLWEARLRDIMSLAQDAPCFRLKRPHRFDLLPKVVEAVIRHHETSV